MTSGEPDQRRQALEAALGGYLVFEQSPDLLNRVEGVAGIGGQEEQFQARMVSQPTAHHAAGMNAHVVEDDVDRPGRIGRQQLFQEDDEVAAAFALVESVTSGAVSTASNRASLASASNSYASVSQV